MPQQPLLPSLSPLLPAFSHVLPWSTSQTHRWPASLDPHAFPLHSTPVLSNILIWVTPYLLPADMTTLRVLGQSYFLGPDYGPLWWVKPWSPNRRCCWGFSIPSTSRTAVLDIPLPHSRLHFAWKFLEPANRPVAVRTCSQWFLYRKMRIIAVQRLVASLLY